MSKTNRKIAHLKELLSIRQRNINFLELKAAKYGDLSMPLDVHNQLVAEKETAETLRLQINRLLQQRPDVDLPASVPIDPLPPTVKAPTILIFEDDLPWRDILVEAATALGCKTQVWPLAQPLEGLVWGNYQVAVIGLPVPETFTEAFGQEQLTALIAQISLAMPLILLTTRDALAVSLAARQALLKNNLMAVATIPKETFNNIWFTRMLKKALLQPVT